MVQNANAGNDTYANSEYKDIITALQTNSIVNTDSAKYKGVETDVDDLFKGMNDKFWDAYIAEVLGDKTGEKYRVVNQWGSAGTL
jgi:hypothetical protein